MIDSRNLTNNSSHDVIIIHTTVKVTAENTTPNSIPALDPNPPPRKIHWNKIDQQKYIEITGTLDPDDSNGECQNWTDYFKKRSLTTSAQNEKAHTNHELSFGIYIEERTYEEGHKRENEQDDP
jgi:hypothetical protein